MLSGSHRDCTLLLCPGIYQVKEYSLRVTSRVVVSLTILAGIARSRYSPSIKADKPVYQRARGVHTPGCIGQPPGADLDRRGGSWEQGVS